MMSDPALGAQPLDEFMTRQGLSNADLVGSSSEQLSFKMVQKGRKGRRISSNIQNKILRAIRAARPDEVVGLKDLFNY